MMTSEKPTQTITPAPQTGANVLSDRELLRLITENVRDMIAVLDFNGKRLYNNHAYEPILGDAASLQGTNSFREIHPDDRERIERIFKETVRTGVGRRTEYRFLLADGSVRHIESEGTVTRGNNGTPGKVVIVSRDITKRKLAEQTLRASERRTLALIENISDGITMLDAEGRFQYVSRSASKIVAVSPEELLHTSCFDRVHPDDLAAVKRLFESLCREPRASVNSQCRLRRGDGGYVWVEGIAVNLLDEPDVRGIVVNFRDITDRKRLEEDLRQMQKMESLGRLAGGIAHDFNNLLAIIMGYSSSLKRQQLDPEKLDQSIDVILQAAQRGAGLVRQLLMFARKSESVFEPLNVNEVVRSVTMMLEQTFPKTITFALDLDEMIHPILADRDQIHQTLINLCVNSRDAMLDRSHAAIAGGTLTIRTPLVEGAKLRTRHASAGEDTYLCLSVEDDGSGMEEETRKRIFEPFFTTKEPGKGTGLGLAVVFGIVQHHKGVIELESHLGLGTTFRLYFPLPVKPNVDRPKEDTSIEDVKGGSETILVVEDESNLLQILRSTLEMKGYRVLTAQDGHEAVAMFKAYKDELGIVLSDMGLPRMSGLESLEAMKKIEPSIPMILASGYVDPDLKADLERAGIDSFIQKPYYQSDLLNGVREVLDQRQRLALP